MASQEASLKRIRTGAQESIEDLRSRSEKLPLITDSDGEHAGFFRSSVVGVLDRAETLFLALLEPEIELRPIQVYVEDVYDDAREQLSDAEMISCSDCVSAESAERAYQIVEDGTGDLSALQRLGFKVRATSKPPHAKAMLFARGDEKPRRSTRTNGSLGFVYVGKYELVAERDGFKEGRSDVDLLNNDATILECELYRVSSQEESFCRQVEEDSR